MKRSLTIGMVGGIVLFSLSGVHAQTIIFSEDFESGSPKADWGLYRAGEEPIQAVAMTSVPKPLAYGGNYVGLVQDADGSYTGAAIVLAGLPTLSNYSIEADVYCYVNQTPSAYTGIAVYADSSKQGSRSKGVYIKLAADFDADQRLRFWNNQLDPTTFQPTFNKSFKGRQVPTGIPTEDGWHHMRIDVMTTGDSTQYYLYFDGRLLGGGATYDKSVDALKAGQFGLYSFQQDADGIPAYFDNIVVRALQPVIYEEHFANGVPKLTWGLYRKNEENVTVVPDPNSPDDDGFVGLVQDADGSYSGASIVLAGEPTLSTYSIEADVYCYVNHPGGSAYTGVAVHADSSFQGSQTHGIYVKVAADFDADQRLRLWNNQLNFTTFQYTFHKSFKAADVPTGIPTADGWHNMKLAVETRGDTVAYNVWFDGRLLKGCPVFDTGPDAVKAGKFGLYSFQQDADGIAAYFDNIIVRGTPGPVSVRDKRPFDPKVPTGFRLAQNYPNPFNPETSISYEVSTAGPITLEVYDVLGKKIRTLVDQTQGPGVYTVRWDGRDDSGERVASGVYLYTLRAGNFSETKKLLFVK